MKLANRREPMGTDNANQANHCGPEPPMYVCDLAINQMTDENIGARSHATGQSKERLAMAVSPPTPAPVPSEHGVGETRHRGVTG